MKLLSYYELIKKINDSSCILNKDVLDYLESLLNYDFSVLDKYKNDNYLCCYLSELKVFRDLVLYNLYKSSLNLVNNDFKDYIFINDMSDRFSIDYVENNVHYSIYNLDYSNDVPNIILYSKSDNFNSYCVNDRFLKYIEKDMIITSEKDRILNRFLVNNNLSLTDFEDKDGVKIKRYGYANVYIKK